MPTLRLLSATLVASSALALGAACGTVNPLVPINEGGGGSAGGPHCTGATTYCGAACTDLATDSLNCGQCENACFQGQGCFGGKCASPATMSTPRVGLGAARGSDDRIYAIGGVDNHGTPLASVENFDPRFNIWTTVAPMSTPRVAPAVVAGADGRIYVSGGEKSQTSLLASVEIYDPKTNAWTMGPAMPSARAALTAAFGADGTLFAIGGADASAVLDTMVGLPAGGMTWSPKASMSGVRYGLAAATLADGKIVVVGGTDGTGGAMPKTLALAESYDPTADAWTTITPMSGPRFEPSLVLDADGLLYAVGGHGADFSTLNTAETYDAKADKWTAIAPMVNVRAALGAALGADGRIYAIGGHAASSADGQSTVEVYEPKGKVWVH